jgi:steroid delta-isomerase-like uncharacterized protein
MFLRWKSDSPPLAGGSARRRSDPVSAEENRALIRRFVEEAFNRGNLEVVDEIYAPDHAGHTAGVPEQTPGPEGVKGFVGLYRSAFPDLHTTVEDMLTEGDKVTYRWTAVGTHQGDLLGIEPSGNRVELTGITIERIEGGRIAETWNNFDQLGMLRQIGAIPAPELDEG